MGYLGGGAAAHRQRADVREAGDVRSGESRSGDSRVVPFGRGVVGAVLDSDLPKLCPRDATRAPIAAGSALREGFAELARTFKEVRKYRAVILFLLAYWMYIDGVNTIMKMAVDYGLALGLPANSLISGILMIQFIGFPATLLFGALGDRISPLVGIFVGIAVYAAVTFYAVFMTTVSEFYLMAAAIGCVQGATQAMSRSYYGRLIPPERAGEFYGFYNMMGKFAAVLGPFLMAVTALLTGNSRMAILSVAILFAGGAIVLVIAARAARDVTPPAGLPETSAG